MVVRAALRFGFGTASLLAGSWLLRALHGAPAAAGRLARRDRGGGASIAALS